MGVGSFLGGLLGGGIPGIGEDKAGYWNSGLGLGARTMGLISNGMSFFGGNACVGKDETAYASTDKGKGGISTAQALGSSMDLVGDVAGMYKIAHDDSPGSDSTVKGWGMTGGILNGLGHLASGFGEVASAAHYQGNLYMPNGKDRYEDDTIDKTKRWSEVTGGSLGALGSATNLIKSRVQYGKAKTAANGDPKKLKKAKRAFGWQLAGGLSGLVGNVGKIWANAVDPDDKYADVHKGIGNFLGMIGSLGGMVVNGRNTYRASKKKKLAPPNLGGGNPGGGNPGGANPVVSVSSAPAPQPAPANPVVPASGSSASAPQPALANPVVPASGSSAPAPPPAPANPVVPASGSSAPAPPPAPANPVVPASGSSASAPHPAPANPRGSNPGASDVDPAVLVEPPSTEGLPLSGSPIPDDDNNDDSDAEDITKDLDKLEQ